jgi:uncharacterized protein with PQ loop repeat
MATTKKVTRVGGTTTTTEKVTRTFVPTPESKAKATQLRIIAVILWVLAIAAEAGAIYVLITSAKPFITTTWIWMIGLIVVDFVLVVIGSQLWKKANRLDPASEKQPVKFFLQNQLGVIIAVIAFLPLVILIFTNKDLDGKTKGILGSIVAVVMLAAGLLSADFNPPSIEQYAEQTNRVEWLKGNDEVIWTKSGKRYHLYDDCSSLKSDRTEELFVGTVAKVREEKNITDLCKFCEKRIIKERNLNEADYVPAATPLLDEVIPEATD